MSIGKGIAIAGIWGAIAVIAFTIDGAMITLASILCATVATFFVAS